MIVTLILNLNKHSEGEIMKFEELGINKEILNALYKQGYEKPSEIQAKAIPYILEGKDVLGLAQTGTGKTAAFAVPTIQNLSKNKVTGKRKIRSLVLTPTRELAIQVYDSFVNYAKNTKIRSSVIYGGVGQGAQVRSLQQGCDVLVATPGRLFDLIEQKHVDLRHVEVFILDEADRMLDMGFIHDIKKTIRLLPKNKQSLLFSATMPKEIVDIVNEIMSNPVKVAVDPVSSTVDKITQDLYYVDGANKIKLLTDILRKEEYKSFLVFTRTKRNADKVSKELNKQGIKSEAIHGDKSQNARQRALNKFKDYKVQVLVATDIAARGIDIDELNYVVNYNLPEEAETYVHRIGRTGRKGLEGAAISFCSYQEIPLLKDIEKLTKTKLNVIENHDYPLEDKSEKYSHKSKGRKKNNQRKNSKNYSQSKAKSKNNQRNRQNKKKVNKKKQLGPHNWSNHKSKKK